MNLPDGSSLQHLLHEVIELVHKVLGAGIHVINGLLGGGKGNAGGKTVESSMVCFHAQCTDCYSSELLRHIVETNSRFEGEEEGPGASHVCLVVVRAAIRVRQHVVRLGYPGELVLCRGIVQVLVGMVDERELPIDLFNLVGGSIARDLRVEGKGGREERGSMDGVGR